MDAAQEVFVFASVAMEEQQAKEVVDRTLRDFKLQGNELKGARLLKTERGRQAITSVINNCAPHARLNSHLKRFALAGKFFEYIFEPALAAQNSLFYGCGFHLYISNLLFAMLRTRDASAEAIFEEFSKFIREGSQAALLNLFPQEGLVVDYTSNPVAAISVFAMMNRNAIEEELQGIWGDKSTPHWILDLTTTSLFSVLRYWGEVYDDLDVSCDESKPIEADIGILKVMVGRRDHVRLKMFGKESQYTFNLVELPRLVDSSKHPGIQIADLFASAGARVFQQRYGGKPNALEEEWWEGISGCVLDDSNVWPDLGQIDLAKRTAFVNAALLIELADRCVKKQDLFEGMSEVIATAHDVFPQFLRDHPALAERARRIRG
jgi:hypothetical protein